jgi:hypothetical protein
MTRQSKELKPLQKGQQFGRLTVIELDHQEECNRKDGQKEFLYYYKFQCSCGNICILNKKNVIRGNTQSCGCLSKEESSKRMTTHGKTNTRLFNIWQGIKIRCFVKTEKVYEQYGLRGITMCEEWKNNFMSFYNWAINNGYSDDLSIDRIDNNGNYEPSNCRWASAKEQNRNTRNNVNITYLGKTQCISAWAEEFGIKDDLLRWRLSKGWDFEKAITTPKRNKRKKIKELESEDKK